MARRVDTSLIPAAPTLDYEKAFWVEGLTRIAGIDEAGRGALAGPVYAAAVVLPQTGKIVKQLRGVRDSKEMSAAQRERWAIEIQRLADQWAVGSAGPDEIDAYGIVPATRLAASRALQILEPDPEHLLIDALTLYESAIPQTSLFKGDQRSLSIAAASVLAKVARDAELRGLDGDFPEYGFARHKGYATAAHRAAIFSLGPCSQHRLSFSPMRVDTS
ncbi:MAG: ribonuclease HII [Chloroflexi bacterium]|nr:ribonuclease HII [Chloroflexota bacterium]